MAFALRNELKEKRDQGDFTWYIDYKNSIMKTLVKGKSCNLIHLNETIKATMTASISCH